MDNDTETIGAQIARKKRYEINFFGWCNEDGHDKIWGWVTLGFGSDRRLYNFWGRRGQKMSFKRNDAEWGAKGLRHITEQKMRPRSNGQYQEVPVADIETVFPDFFNEFERQLTLAKLFNRVRGEDDGTPVDHETWKRRQAELKPDTI